MPLRQTVKDKEEILAALHTLDMRISAIDARLDDGMAQLVTIKDMLSNLSERSVLVQSTPATVADSSFLHKLGLK